MESDKELVTGVLAGRRELYADLVKRHERALLAVAVHILGDFQTAQDATQEAFVLAFHKLATLRKPDAFGPWAARIARRVAASMGRSRRKVEPLRDDLAAAPPLDGHPDDRLRLVLRHLDRLPEHQRQAILLRYFAGHGAEQIAEMTGQPAGTVKAQISRGLAKLRERWKESEA